MSSYSTTRVAARKHRGFWAGLGPSGFGIAVLALVLGAGAGFGSRWGWWHFRTGFAILEWAAYCGLAAAVLSLLGLAVGWRRSSTLWRVLAGIGIVVGLAVVGMPLSEIRIAKSVPAIHDITTDTDHPPAFVAILPLRAHADNPPEYGGAEVAAKQHQGYPQIVPLEAAAPPDKAFEAALATARSLGWNIVAAEPAEGRIEANETSFWFGFTDDVVVRVAAAGAGSRIDVRSESRVGRSDIGVNAHRIERFLVALKTRLGSSS